MSKNSSHKRLKPWQRNEIMAMCQWMEQNDPDFENPLKVVSPGPEKARLIRKATHRKKALRSNRQHY